MQEAPATEVSAAKAREHLIAFVEEMVACLPHAKTAATTGCSCGRRRP